MPESVYRAAMDDSSYSEPPVLAVDIGGTKLATAIVSDDGTVTCATRRRTEGSDADGLFDNLAELIDGVLADHRAAGGVEPWAIGVGCGGPMTSGGEEISPLNIGQWRSFPLRRRLAARFGLPIFVDNDAKALALGEGWLGAARGEDNYLAMVVSTGVGAGLVLDGRLVDGASGNAGHLGHVVVVPDGRPCVCGSRGCLEAEASGLSIEALTGRTAADAPLDIRVRTGTLVGRAVAAAAVLTDLRMACVGGSVALGFGDVFFDAANAELARVARISFTRGARIVPISSGNLGPLIGAAMVARRHSDQRADQSR